MDIVLPVSPKANLVTIVLCLTSMTLSHESGGYIDLTYLVTFWELGKLHPKQNECNLRQTFFRLSSEKLFREQICNKAKDLCYFFFEIDSTSERNIYSLAQ